jgi:hydroxyethylthiazole kinase-like uncharacterized protein yjeF
MAILPADTFPGENISDVEQFLQEQTAGYYCFNDEDIRKLIRPRDPAGHKGSFGHALMIAGSEGTSGAAVLACSAALRTGCGLLTAFIPASAQTPLLTLLPEAMTMIRESNTSIPGFGKFQSIGFGPGVGMEASSLLDTVLQAELPLVIDADGLTLLAKQPDQYKLLSPRIVLTPHPAEFDRLAGMHTSVFERIKTQIAFSKQYKVNVLLKGRHTSIATPEGKVYFNTTGNNGMATAGSGDVLTGIITSLLAQGYEPGIAAILGAWLHGYAGDRAAERKSKTGLIASDIISGIADFFLVFEKA